MGLMPNMMQNKVWIAACAAVMAMTLASCSSSSPTAAEEAASGKESQGSAVPAPEASKAAFENSPVTYKAKFETTAGDFVIAVHRDWAPLGADRFAELVNSHFLDGGGFFRVVPGFVVQFGLSPDPKMNAQWEDKRIADDPVRMSNTRGRVTFATSGPNSRTTQLFINYADNSRLDGAGFAPFGEVVEGMDVVDKINPQYGEAPEQSEITEKGNAYLKKEFPKLDFIKKVSIVQ
jgi:peptidyl-prolyl cis-trans isomerase A (cyclophilin A)